MNALEIHGLRKSYGDFSLDGIDLALPSGCIMGLVVSLLLFAASWLISQRIFEKKEL